jgi:acetyl-CoA carboxylase/biotin carboxylase 1
VAKTGAQKVIKRVLVANNGIGAVKLIRSVRKWAYDMFGNERAVGVSSCTPLVFCSTMAL